MSSVKCRYCSAEAVEGRTSCQWHLDYAAAQQRRVTARRRAVGMCPGCGIAPPAEGLKRCRACSDYSLHKRREWLANNPGLDAKMSRDRYARRRAAGLCGYCGAKPAPNRACCQRCIDRARDRRQKKPAAG